MTSPINVSVAATVPTTISAAPPPVVLVSGFFGLGGSWYWGEACNIPTSRRVIVAHVGPFSSLHDRACELFYKLKGGRVDYGATHSASYGHDQYGVTYAGEYPQWSATQPLHLVGHSMGGCTILYLLQLLADGFFLGMNTNESWIRSLTTISSPLRGTTTCYILGAHEAQERCPGRVRFFSPGSFLSKLIHVYEWMDIRSLKQAGIDLNLGHWQLSWRTSLLSSIQKLIGALTGYSPLADRTDNAAYDLTLHATKEWAKRIETYPNVFYRSYAASQSQQSRFSKNHLPTFRMNPAMFLLSVLIGRKTFSSHYPLAADIVAEDWFENDGTASTISQYHPHACDDERCDHRQTTVQHREPDHARALRRMRRRRIAVKTSPAVAAATTVATPSSVSSSPSPSPSLRSRLVTRGLGLVSRLPVVPRVYSSLSGLLLPFVSLPSLPSSVSATSSSSSPAASSLSLANSYRYIDLAAKQSPTTPVKLSPIAAAETKSILEEAALAEELEPGAIDDDTDAIPDLDAFIGSDDHDNDDNNIHIPVSLSSDDDLVIEGQPSTIAATIDDNTTVISNGTPSLKKNNSSLRLHTQQCAVSPSRHDEEHWLPAAGRWQVHELQGVNHVDIVPFPSSCSFQRAFFAHVYSHLDDVDRAAASLATIHINDATIETNSTLTGDDTLIPTLSFNGNTSGDDAVSPSSNSLHIPSPAVGHRENELHIPSPAASSMASTDGSIGHDDDSASPASSPYITAAVANGTSLMVPAVLPPPIMSYAAALTNKSKKRSPVARRKQSATTPAATAATAVIVSQA